MHELSVVQSFVEIADRAARTNGAKRVKYVTLEVGEMTGVIPKYMLDYYPDVCEGTLLEGSELRIEEVKALAFCKGCGNTYSPVEHDRCPACAGTKREIIQGNSLMLKELAFI